MKMNINIIPVLCFLLLCSCKNGNASSQSTNETIQDTIKSITLPAIPAMMTAPEQRADFLVKHYWDNVNFADTNYIHHPEVTEQAWADYCDILNHVPLETAQEAMRKTIERTNVDKKVFTYITDLADKYLYDPNSPMRNEEFYIPVLDAMLDSPLLEEIEKVRPKARRELAQKNRIGTKALNFNYTLASGAQGSLYQLQAEYILLFINNPGCHACTETIDALKNAPIINQLLEQKRLTVLSIYPDEELDEWRKHLNEFPQEWINGYDKKFAIKEQQLYDLKAIPTLYLLNKEKTVLLKDATAQAVEEYLLIKSEQ
ncbi:DUF5106 domain-containing protein [Bacteroides caecimuris]|uniref:DUF5106 domain-containing protein n=1 Tax=Bacteroides caecimuris TaxID=1796613 RepID=A0A4S2DF73_9BACE|nr:DUF5106 domain-containing protein [Bacteroides caecimuris]TGY40102.1 DUF5106 domain-containing protein [Bacteroides caecimuris]